MAMNLRSYGGSGSPCLGISSVVVAATTVGYVGLLGQQGSLNGFDARIAFVLTLLIGSAILSGIGTFTPSATTRATTAGACAGALLPLGILGAFSIGLPLLAAGAFALLAWRIALREASTRSATVQSVAGFIGVVVVLVLGFVLTSS